MAYVSRTYDEMFGRPAHELYHRAGAWIDAVHPEDRRRVLNVFEQSVRGIVTTAEYRIIRLVEASVRRIHGRSFPIQDAKGKEGRIVGIA
jgi:PAS domain-containing protein